MKAPLALSALSLAALLLAAPAFAGEVYSSRSAGFSIEKPDGWHFTAQLEDDESVEKRLPDDEMEQRMGEIVSWKLVTITKYAESPPDKINPQILVNLRFVARPNTFSHSEMVAGAMSVLHGQKDFSYVDLVEPFEVNGLQASKAKVAYTAVDGSGAEWRMATRVAVIPRGNFMFIIYMSGPESGPDVSDAEFAKAFESIHIEP